MLNTKALIDGLVRQTTVLIAHVATSAGLRAPLAHIANQVFVDLTGELEQQGVTQKVIADMFGLALRSYQQKLQRLSESATDQGKTLWIAVYEFISTKQAVRRVDVLQRFARDDEASIKAILKDLCESGLVYRTGRAEATNYRATPPEDFASLGADDSAQLSSMLWLEIHRAGPVTHEQLAARLPLSKPVLAQVLATLLAEGRILTVEGEGVQYRADEALIPLGARQGWEAALLDHFQAVVRSMCIKLQNGATRALPDDQVGGSTYTFDIWPGHPDEERVRSLLKNTRHDVSALWDSVTAHNRSRADAGDAQETLQRFTFYCGQSATAAEGPLT